MPAIAPCLSHNPCIFVTNQRIQRGTFASDCAHRHSVRREPPVPMALPNFLRHSNGLVDIAAVNSARRERKSPDFGRFIYVFSVWEFFSAHEANIATVIARFRMPKNQTSVPVYPRKLTPSSLSALPKSVPSAAALLGLHR